MFGLLEPHEKNFIVFTVRKENQNFWVHTICQFFENVGKVYETCLKKNHKNTKKLVQNPSSFYFKMLSSSTTSNLCGSDFIAWR